MELLDFVQSIGGHIAFRSCMDPKTMLMEVAREHQTLCTRPYPGGRGSICVWVKIRNGDINAAYETGLVNLANELSEEPSVGFDDDIYTVPELMHTGGYRPKQRKKVLS